MDLQGRSFFLSPSHNLFIFQKLKPDPQWGARLFCYVCNESAREREREEAGQISTYHDFEILTHWMERERERPALFTVWSLLSSCHMKRWSENTLTDKVFLCFSSNAVIVCFFNILQLLYPLLWLPSPSTLPSYSITVSLKTVNRNLVSFFKMFLTNVTQTQCPWFDSSWGPFVVWRMHCRIHLFVAAGQLDLWKYQ